MAWHHFRGEFYFHSSLAYPVCRWQVLGEETDNKPPSSQSASPPPSKHLKMIGPEPGKPCCFPTNHRATFIGSLTSLLCGQKPLHHSHRGEGKALLAGLQLFASRRAPGEAKLGEDHQAALGRERGTVAHGPVRARSFHWAQEGRGAGMMDKIAI